MLKVLRYIWKKPLIILGLIVVIFAGGYFIKQASYNNELEKNAEYTVTVKGKEYYIPCKMLDINASVDYSRLRPISRHSTETFLTRGSRDGLTLYGYNPSNQSVMISDYTVIGFGYGLKDKSVSFLGISIGDDESKIAEAMSAMEGFVLEDGDGIVFKYVNKTCNPPMHIKFNTNYDKVTSFSLVPLGVVSF